MSSIVEQTAAIVSRRDAYSAAAAVVCLLAFSVLNCFQKNHLDFPGSLFGLDVTLLFLTAVFGRLALTGKLHKKQRAYIRLTTPRHYDPLMTLRLFACFMVLSGHGIGFAFRSPQLIPSLGAGSSLWLVTSAPEAGVWMFFTLSGYLIGKGFFSGRYVAAPESVGRYYRKRILRIVPIFWFTVTAFSLLKIPSIFAINNLRVFINILFFNVDGRYPFIPIGAIWSVATEMNFYLGAPFLFIFLDKFATRKQSLFAIVATVAILEIGCRIIAFRNGGLGTWYSYAYEPLIGNLDLFLIGMATSRFVINFSQKEASLKYGLLAGGGSVVFLYFVTTYLRSHAVLVPHHVASAAFAELAPTLTALLTALAIFCLEMAPKHRVGSAVYRILYPTQILGTLTYASYLWHEPIFLEVKNRFTPPPSVADSVLVLTLVVVLVFLVAWIVYTVIERPIERRKLRGKAHK